LQQNFGKNCYLGPKINTAALRNVIMHSDQKRLYFSSDGLFGFGGLDIFYFVRRKRNWKEPENLNPYKYADDDAGLCNRMVSTVFLFQTED